MAGNCSRTTDARPPQRPTQRGSRIPMGQMALAGAALFAIECPSAVAAVAAHLGNVPMNLHRICSITSSAPPPIELSLASRYRREMALSLA